MSAVRRVVGLDLYRGLAIFGMFVAHVGPAAWVPGPDGGTVSWVWEIFHSRMPAMFAIAAGIGLAFSSGARNPVRGRRLGFVVVRTLARAVFLGVLGLALVALHTPAMVILTYFAVYFVLSLPFLWLSARALAWWACGVVILGPVLSWLARSALGAQQWFLAYPLTGGYPALTWMPFILAGMAIGRLDLRSHAVRLRLGIGGTALAVIAYLVGWAADRFVLRAMMPQFAETYFAETGVSDTSSWAWLLSAAPHSGSIMDVLGCLGVGMAVLALMLPFGDWLGTPSRAAIARGAAWLMKPVACAGAMSLSVYVAHIVAMWLFDVVTGRPIDAPASTMILVVFTVVIFGCAWVWERLLGGRGPMERIEYGLCDGIAKRIVPAR